MNLLVCISKTPETTSKISFNSDNSAFNTEGIQYIMNPYDEWYALVRALELKEKGGGKVVVLNVGPSENDIVIRKALAIGADEAVRINAEPKSALFVAEQISNYVKENAFDIIFLGKETIDYHGALVGGMVAEKLGLPFLSFASHMESDGSSVTAKCDIEGGVEVVKSQLPVVISAAKGFAEQRIPNMRGIMMAKRKPLNVIEPISAEDQATVSSFKLPESKSGVKLIDPENMDELVRLLNEEAKVI